MRNIEMLRHVSIGQYIPGNSLIHRMDPTAKLLCLVSLILAVTFGKSYRTHLILATICLLIVRKAGLSMRYVFSGVRPALPFILVVAVLQLLLQGSQPANDTILWQWGILRIGSVGIQLVAISLFRLLELLSLISLLTNTTTTSQLSRGVERLLRPLDAVGFPGHDVSLVLTIALRFLPLLAMQLETIMKAQASRGANLEAEGAWHFVSTTRRRLALIVPLFLDAFRRAEHLATAMEARCYLRDGSRRTHLIRAQWRMTDVAITIGTALFSVVLIVIEIQYHW